MPLRPIALILQSLAILVSIFLSHSSLAEDAPVTLRLQWKHQFEFAGFYAAKELGYYKDAGLDVRLLEYEIGVDIIDEVSSGESEFGIWGSGIIEQAMRGEPVVLLANYFKRSPLVLATQPDISFPSELEGRTLMVSNADRESANYTQMFETFNVNVDSIEFVPPTFSIREFADKAVDGVSVFLTNEPYLLKKEGVPYNIIDPNNYGVDLYDVNLFTSRAFAESSPQQVEAFIEASNRGWEYALEYPQQIIDLIIEKYNSQNKSRDHLLYEAQQSARMIQPKSYQIGSVDAEQVNRISNLFTEVGLTDKELPEGFIFSTIKPQIELSSDERAFLSTHPEVRVALMPDFNPFSFIERGEPQGYEHDLLALLGDKTGLQFTAKYGIWNEGLSDFKSREVDIIASISYREDRTEFTRFTEPYYEIPIMVYVRDDFGTYEGLNSLAGKRVGILKDVFYTEDLRKRGDLDLVIYETYEQLTKALVYGRIDALMQNLTNIESLIRENAYTNLRVAGELQLPGIEKEDLRLGIRSDQPLLHSIVQKGLDSITSQERMAIASKWLGSRANEATVTASFSATERAYLSDKGAIRMCVDPNWMPLESLSETGEHIGISAEILKLMQKNTGIRLQLVPTNSWAETLTKAQDRQCDILSLAMRTQSREEYLDFTLPYVTYPFVIATLDQNQFIDDLKILNSKKLAMIRGFSTVEMLAESYPEIGIVEVDSLDEGIAKVRSGEVYGYVDALPTIATAIQQQGMTDLYIAGKLDTQFALSVATRNDEPLLLNIMQKAMATVPSEAIQAINNRWLAVKFESRVDYSLLYKVVGAFLVIGLLVLWRQREIQRTNKIIEEKNLELEKLAMTDMLTGLSNRHKMDGVLNQQLELAQRYQSSFAVLLLDIDHFKLVNDTHGHNVGDAVLEAFATILSEQTRNSDTVSRWGGEEFLIAVPQADKVELERMAENLRQKIESYPFPGIDKLSTSIGVASYKSGESISELVSRADNALYRAKEQGRNRVCFDS